MPRFFGLTPTDKEVFLEQIFLLMYYMGFTYSESYNLPIWQRAWFLRRLQKEIKQSSGDDSPAPTRAAHQNDPTTRSLMGRHRAQSPARLRRFT